MSEHMNPIPSRIYNAAVGGHVCGPEDIDFGQKVVHLIKYDRDGNEISFESQVTQANKIYVIHDDFTLSDNITIPANCVLEFDGGSISGAYTITGTNTIIAGKYKFDSVLFAGTYSNKEINITSDFSGTLDFYGIMECFSNAQINLYRNIESTVTDKRVINGLNLNGNGYIVKVKGIKFANSSKDVKIHDCVFDMSIGVDMGNGDGILYFCGNGTNSFKTSNTIYKNIGSICPLYIREAKDVDIVNCYFNGTLEGVGNKPDNQAIMIYDISGVCIIDNCTIKDIDGKGIRILVAYNENNRFTIQNCTIENLSGQAMIATGGKITNCTVFNNTVKDVVVGGNTIGEEDAFNFHGAYNLRFINNRVYTPKCPFLGLNGNNTDGTYRCEKVLIDGNIMYSGHPLIFWFCKDVVVSNNIIEIEAGKYGDYWNNINIPLVFSGSSVNFVSNTCKITAPTTDKGTIFKLHTGKNNTDYDLSVLFDKNIFELTNNNTVSFQWTLTELDSTIFSSSKKKDITLGNNAITFNIEKPVTWYLRNMNITYLYSEKRRITINPSKTEKIVVIGNTEQKEIIGARALLRTTPVLLGNDITLISGRYLYNDSPTDNFTYYKNLTIPATLSGLIANLTLDSDASKTAGIGYFLNTDGTGADVDIEVEMTLTDYPLMFG